MEASGKRDFDSIPDHGFKAHQRVGRMFSASLQNTRKMHVFDCASLCMTCSIYIWLLSFGSRIIEKRVPVEEICMLLESVFGVLCGSNER